MNAISVRVLRIAATLFGVLSLVHPGAKAASLAVSAGRPVTLNATADGSAPFTYKWYKNGSLLAGATEASYVIASFQAVNAGTYTAVISNDAGSATSEEAVLTLAIANVAPVISTQPTNQTVTAGNSATFVAAASGTPSPTYQWKKNGLSIAGATSASYTLTNTAASDAGSYAVVATNSAGSVTSYSATLTVNLPNSAPVIVLQPLGQSVVAGGFATFTTAASGLPAPTFQWRKNGVAIPGATSATYTLASTTIGDAGAYTVVASNSVGAVTSNIASLAVSIPVSAPAITSQPVGRTVAAGGSVTFTATASGVPAPTYQWKRNGSALAGATGSSYTRTNLTAANEGVYTVVATNSAGSATSNGAVLTVTSVPAFTIQPVSQGVTAGDAVTFVAAASGSPAPTYQWKKGGVVIAGATGASYTIPSVATVNGGSFSVVATNSIGAVTSNAAILTVNPAPSQPVFTVQPANQTVIAGGPVSLVAAATGSPAPMFQWKKNGVAIPGATSATYAILLATTADEGSYSVVASNTVGTATSNAAVLSVNAPPQNALLTLTIIK